MAATPLLTPKPEIDSPESSKAKLKEIRVSSNILRALRAHQIVSRALESFLRVVPVKADVPEAKADVDGNNNRPNEVTCVPAVYYEHFVCILIKLATTLSRDQVQLKTEIFDLVKTILTEGFHRDSIKIKSEWFEHLIDQSKSLPETDEKAQIMSELYYTLYFFVELFDKTDDSHIIRVLIRAMEPILTNIFEHKIVAVYPTAFLLTAKIFEFDNNKNGLTVAPHLYQHVMGFFRLFFNKLSDGCMTIDSKFLVQVRIVTNFLATISKYQPEFIRGVSMNFFLKAGNKVAALFQKHIENNANDEKIFENSDYQNLLRSVTSIVRVITPCLHNATQEVSRNVAQAILMPAVPVGLPSHLVDDDLLTHVTVTLIPLLRGPAAPSYCVPLLARLCVFRHKLLKPPLKMLFNRIEVYIETTPNLKQTRLGQELELIMVVEKFKDDLKKIQKMEKEMVELEGNLDEQEKLNSLRETVQQILEKHLNFQIPSNVSPPNMYEVPTLIALRALAMEYLEKSRFGFINEQFLMAIHIIEETKKQPQAAMQRIREEERKVFKYYSVFLEKSLQIQISKVKAGETVWNVVDVLDSANLLLVTARALRYANAKQGTQLVERFIRTGRVMLDAKAATTCEISKWMNYITIALSEVPIEHWTPALDKLVQEMSRDAQNFDADDIKCMT
ncbi:unnamed protein product [Bursaphelenchus okinawaensis]|uniref:Uncharacterized protein n=1 Tax=Bursaphelenchus okinawaensis TaxID=465554 RepID=A0A811KEE9_9BILA|nr:unnamed protein product [Bursaphelenchus okinawaensis]CAG9101694.1 unnamed protein product [Bursaphelenchus okinawaensis]